MTPVFVTLDLVLHEEPTRAFQHVKEAAQRGGAVITHASRFSNKALSVQLEVEARHLVSVRDSLAAVGHLTTGGTDLEGLALSLSPEAEVRGFLHVTLVHDAPDERIELPKVPG